MILFWLWWVLGLSESWIMFPVHNHWLPYKKMSPKLKMLEPAYVTRRLIWRQTPKRCITDSKMNWKYSPSFLKHNKGYKKHESLNNSCIITATEITRMGYFYKYTCLDRSIDLFSFTNFSGHRVAQGECARMGRRSHARCHPYAIPQPLKVGHTTGVYAPYSFRIVV